MKELLEIMITRNVILIKNMHIYRSIKIRFLVPETFIDFRVWKSTNIPEAIYFFNEKLLILCVTFQAFIIITECPKIFVF